MANTGPAISLHVKITIAPENVEKFLEALKPAYDGVCAEPKCAFFEVYQSPDQPGAFKFIENWNADKQWMTEVQFKKDYYIPYLAITEPMWVKPRDIEIWERMPGNEWVSIKKDLYQGNIV